MMSRLFDGYCRLLNGLLALASAVMVVLVFGNVVLRYAFHSAIAVSEEVSRWLACAFIAPQRHSRSSPVRSVQHRLMR
jgi:TRAP-type C4-dicarboxylate transport system permease small subunit